MRSGLTSKLLLVVPRLHPNLQGAIFGLSSMGWEVSAVCGADSHPVFDSVKVVVPPPRIGEREAAAIWSEVKPDAVIIRSHQGWEKVFARQARLWRIPSLVYTQNPFVLEQTPKSYFDEAYRVSRRVRGGLPARAFSPVGRRSQGRREYFDHFLPLPIKLPAQQKVSRLTSQSPVRILMVGKLDHRRKRHDWLLRALSELKVPFRLKIAGTRLVASPDKSLGTASPLSFSSSNHESSLMLLIEELKIQSFVEFHDSIGVEEMEELYRWADIFCLPSANEPYAISPAEAMSFGLPVLVSASSGSASYIEDGVDGYTFEEGSYGDFVKKLRLLIEKPESWGAIGVRARNRISRDHDPNAFATAVTELLGFDS
jgi:glycosyltransferase involved in cell wall biosynthesis